jgi:hypothetical protein
MQDRDGIDDLFALARERRMVPSEALVARVLADAAAEQPKARPEVAGGVAGGAVLRPVSLRARGGWLGRLAGVFGGFGGLAGVGGAALAGVVLGFAQPAQVTDFTDAVTYSVLGGEAAALDLMPTTDSLMAEE